MPILNDYLDVVQAASILRVYWETVKRVCRENRIPAYKVHNKWLIHTEALQRFAEGYGGARGNKGKRPIG